VVVDGLSLQPLGQRKTGGQAVARLSNPRPIVYVGGAQRALPDALLLVSYRPT
jgi:hypothetical protein